MKIAFIRFTFIVCVVLLLSSCRCKQQAFLPSSPVVLHERDSVHTEYVERVRIDTITVTLEVPAQTATVQVRDSVSFLETDFASSEARILPDGSLFHYLFNKAGAFDLPAYVPTKETQEVEKVYVDREVPVEVPVAYEVEKELTRWQRFRLDAFWWLIGVSVLSVGWICRKWIKKLIL